MTAKKDHLSLYLSRYAEPSTHTISQWFPENLLFEYCIVIPAYNEKINFLKKIKESNLSQASLLIIVVINQPDNIPSSIENQQLWQSTKEIGEVYAEQNNCHLTHWKDTKTFLLTIDHFTNERRLPSKQGVGLARKVGCDIACALIAKKMIVNNWIHTSDADTQLPEEYLSCTPIGENFSAAIYPFKHTGSTPTDHSINQATSLYEQSLHYYVRGLTYAGSPYAYHSLGSCIAINAVSYAQARGFPKRAGGEDFYLLNKLRKLGQIKQLSGKGLSISARLSDRAPFGTGPAVAKIIEQASTSENYDYYNPLIFKELKSLLLHFELLFEQKDNPEKWLEACSPLTQSALSQLNIHSLLKHIAHHASNKKECLKQTQDWFDAFKTLKFIHLLNEQYDSVPLKGAIEQLSAISQQTTQA